MRIATFIVSVTLLAGIPTLAQGSIAVGDRIRFTNQDGSTGGGEFGVHEKLSASPAGGNAQTAELFRTFCVEKNENLDFDSLGFVVDSISDDVISGGSGGGSPDPLDARTEWLFYHFTQGTLVGYDYTPAGRTASADSLQHAIWGLENEEALDNANLFVEAANAATALDLEFADSRVVALNIKWATDRHGFDGVYENVSGVWSTPGPGTNAQTVLYVIPEAATFVIWSVLGLIGIGGRRPRS